MESKFNPTPGELEILQILWKEEEGATVKFVNNELNKTKDVGYTTTLKLMQIMAEKGMLVRESKGRSHVYYPMIKETDTQDQLLDKFLKRTFKGSASKLIMRALGNHKASKDELDEIKKLINKIEQGGKP